MSRKQATTTARLAIAPRILCIMNPASRDGAVERRWPSIHALFEEAGIALDVIDLQREDLVASLLEHLRERDYAAMACVGGDGTNFAVVNAWRDIRAQAPRAERLPLLMLPLGTGNNTAKSFGIGPSLANWKRQVGALTAGRRQPLDWGVYNRGCFIDALSIGLDAAILAQRETWQERLAKRRHGMPVPSGYLLYILAGLRVFWQAPRGQCEITVDGNHWYSGHYINILLNNTRLYAGELDPLPGGEPDDGRCELLVLRDPLTYARKYMSACRFLPLGWRKWQPNLAADKPARIVGRQFRIALEPAAAIQVDGELGDPLAQLEVTVERRAMSLLLPPWPWLAEPSGKALDAAPRAGDVAPIPAAMTESSLKPEGPPAK